MRIPTEKLAEKYWQNIFRIALGICKNPEDAEDITQDTFVQYHLSKKDFQSEEHIRAFLIRAAINKSKNLMKAFWRRNRCDLEEYLNQLTFDAPEEDSSLIQSVLSLPEKYRIVLHLFYYEDYSIKEIAEILQRNENTIKSQLKRGRKSLEELLKEDIDL